ncbi:MAG TPA: cobalt ECF transporter T component CbiQ [bacterium]
MHHSFLDKHADLKSILHRRDPRVKTIIFMAFIISIIFTDSGSYSLFAAYGGMILLLIILSRIPLLFLFKRSLVVIPFVLVIAAFIPFFKKGHVIGGFSLGVLKLTVTYDGLMVLWNVFIKSYLCAFCMILLTSSTRFTDLLKGIERLHCHKLIVMVLSFMYRYAFVFEDEMEMMQQAKLSRTVGGSRWFHFKILANMLGSLFVRSYERGEAVYLAMCSRGFNGEIKTMDRLKLSGIDLVFLLSISAVLVSLRLLLT